MVAPRTALHKVLSENRCSNQQFRWTTPKQMTVISLCQWQSSAWSADPYNNPCSERHQVWAVEWRSMTWNQSRCLEQWRLWVASTNRSLECRARWSMIGRDTDHCSDELPSTSADTQTQHVTDTSTRHNCIGLQSSVNYSISGTASSGTARSFIEATHNAASILQTV